jgi:hypothetical protein
MKQFLREVGSREEVAQLEGLEERGPVNFENFRRSWMGLETTKVRFGCVHHN